MPDGHLSGGICCGIFARIPKTHSERRELLLVRLHNMNRPLFPPQGGWIKSIKPDIVVKITYKHQFPVVCAFPTLLTPCRNVHPSSFSSYFSSSSLTCESLRWESLKKGGGGEREETKSDWAGGCPPFSSSLIGGRWRPFGRWNVINEAMEERRAFVAVIEHPNGPTRLCLCDPPTSRLFQHEPNHPPAVCSRILLCNR